MLTDRQEEILETLWIELVERGKSSCDAKILKDNESLALLADSGYVKLEVNKVSLTPRGTDDARSCVRRHRLAERLFVDVLDAKSGSVHEKSCKFEHLLHKGLDDNICTLLGHPRTCPHGRPIPEGICCRNIKKMPQKIIMSLAELTVNAKARIAYLRTEDRSALQKAIAIGALPGAEIHLIQKFPSYVFQLGKSQFAVDKELALQIYVRTL